MKGGGGLCPRGSPNVVEHRSQCTIQLPCFQIFLCSSKYRTKQRKDAPFRFIAFKIIFSAGQSIVYNSGRMHHLDALLSKISLQYKKIASKCNTVLIINISRGSWPTECMLQIHCFQFFLCSSKSFQIPSQCMFQRHRFHFYLWPNFCVASLHYFKKKYFFSSWQTLQNI